MNKVLPGTDSTLSNKRIFLVLCTFPLMMYVEGGGLQGEDVDYICQPFISSPE